MVEFLRKARELNLRKPPSVSETLDWAHVLVHPEGHAAYAGGGRQYGGRDRQAPGRPAEGDGSGRTGIELVMERIITSFVAALREAGSASPRVRAWMRSGPGAGRHGRAGRSSRQLLQLTLVKNVNDIPVFNEVFNRFFSRYQLSTPGNRHPTIS